MKKLAVSLLLAILAALISNGQEGKKVPSVALRSLDGTIQNSLTMGKTGNPVIILFWASWCRPCMKEMAAIAELYGEWKEKTGVVIYAVSIDDSRTQAAVAPLVRSRGWEFEFFTDTNGDFKRSMGVVDIPHLFILNARGDIIHQRTGYIEGSEEGLFRLLEPSTGNP